MYVYSTVQLFVKVPNQIDEIVWTRALEVKEGNTTYCKRKRACLKHLSWPCRCVYVPSYSYNTTENTGE